MRKFPDAQTQTELERKAKDYANRTQQTGEADKEDFEAGVPDQLLVEYLASASAH